MTSLCVKSTCASWSNTNPCHCLLVPSVKKKKKKKKKKNLHEPFQTVKVHHDAPNSHVPGIKYLDFLVHALSMASSHR